MAQIDWRFMQPLDQSNQIAAMASGNQQVNAGLAAMGGAVTGYADALKQRNTDNILNALYQAQTTADLPNALSAVQALQQQYGRGFDQAAVRNAIDTRGSTLGQRDLQAISLQQAQAAQAAIPQLNQAAMAEAVRQGASAEQLSPLAALGIDVTGQISRMGSNAQSDSRYTAEAAERKANRAEDVEWRKFQATQSQQNWKADFDQRVDQYNWSRGGDLAKENPASSGFAVDSNGNLVTVNNPGISRLDAYGALSGVRGIRNNNPGNLNFAGQAGASRENGKGRFAAFNTPEEGIGALSKQLDLHFNGTSTKAKEAGRPLRSVKDIVEAWAPPNENNTAKYIADIAKQLGVSPTANLNLKDPATKTALMKAIVVKENGGNPYTDAQYAAGISGKKAAGSSALQAIGKPVSQASMSKITSDFQTSLAKLNAEYSNQAAKAQVKGSLAATGKNVDTWAASNRGKDNTWFTNAGDLAKMAKQDAIFNQLPQDAQINVLNGAFAKMNDVNAVQYVPDADLKKFISAESTAYKQERANQFNVQKQALMEQAYQGIVGQFQQQGQLPPSRASVMQLLDPQTAKQQAPKAQPVPTATTPTKAATTVPVKAANEKAVSKASTPKPDKQAIVDFMVKKGTNLYPDGLDGVKDKTLIREAATEARKIIEANKVKAQQAEKAKEEVKKKQSLAEIDRLKQAYADKQAAKIAAERKKQEEQRKLLEQKKLEEQQKLSKLFSPRV